MHPFRYHVFVCDQRKPEGQPSCPGHGSQAVIDALRREVAARQLSDSVMVTTCGSLGLCEHGPNLVVYPEGTWYSGLTAADVPELVTEHFQNGRPLARLVRQDERALKQEITETRSRAMAALKARDAAGAIPEELAETVRGYMASRIVLTALELDLFTALARAGSPLGAPAVAAALATDPRATEALLNALVALGLLVKKDGAFANGPLAARFLVAGARDDASVGLKHNLSLWKTWSNLTQAVREGHPPPRGDMDQRGDDWTTPFIAAMHKNAATRAPVVVQAVGVAQGARRLIDIGGGSGAYSIAFAQAHPSLSCDVFDLSTVVPIAARHVAEAGLTERVHTVVGDLRKDAFGTGYDLALLSAICHMLGPEENRDLLKRVFAALGPGGRVVIQDNVMSADKTLPKAGAIFAINMLVGTERGGSYSKEEYTSWLAEAGFGEVRHVSMGGPSDLMVGTRR
ncbi:MAG: methyltransferase domain-containing protein [Deltaproteobacteria bacterium]|nr:methyltransferase domain-containing protein [Deltaproteobacteria bacterium]